MLRDELFQLQDIEYKKFHSRLCKTKYEIIGVRLPLLRKLVSKYKDDLDNIGNKYYEEVMLQGFIISSQKKDCEKVFKQVDEFIPKIDNWAICDSFSGGLKITNKNKEFVWNYLKKYYNSNKEFELRFLLDMLIDYFLEEKYLDDIIKIINNIDSDYYYVKMGVAWLISFIYIKYPIYMKEKFNELKVTDWVYNKSIQKIIESNRISKEEKEILRKMKK